MGRLHHSRRTTLLIVLAVLILLWSVRFMGKPPAYFFDSLKAFQLFPSEYDYMLWSQEPEHAPPGTWTPTYLPGALQRPYGLQEVKKRTERVTQSNTLEIGGLETRYKVMKETMRQGSKYLQVIGISGPTVGTQQLYSCPTHYPHGYMSVIYGATSDQLYTLDEWYDEYIQMKEWYLLPTDYPGELPRYSKEHPWFQVRWTKLSDGTRALYISTEPGNKPIRHRRSPDVSEDVLQHQFDANIIFVRGDTTIDIGLETMCMPEGLTTLEPELIKVADSLVESK